MSLPPGERIPTDFDAGDDGDDDPRTLAGAAASAGSPLPIGHRLQEFVLEGLVGEGGFGIVYLARDTHLGRKVALKEYMPSALATRRADHSVTVRSERHRETFELGLHSFINEAQLLASFDHPSLVKVYRFWQQNGTAYMVMPYYEGPTLKRWLAEHRGTPDEAWLRALLASLIDALELIHNDHCYHRDIAPDNILLLTGRDGGLRPLLLDFGAARRVIGDATQALTVILKPGYAPVEQYAETASARQGPWTDVYALCAVLYNAVTGRVPLPSVSRIMADDLLPAAQAAADRYSPEFLAAIDAGMAVRPEHRPQSMSALRSLFEAPPSGFADTDALATVVLPASRPAIAPGPPQPRHDEEPAGELPTRMLASTFAMAGEQRAAPAERVRSPIVPALGVAAVLAAAVAIGWWAIQPGSSTQPLPAAAGAAASTPVAAAPPAPTPADPPAPATTAGAAAVPEPAPATAPSTPFTVVAALQDIVRLGNPQIAVDAVADKSSLTIGRDRLQFRVQSSESGYLYLFFGGTDKSHFYLLFPNQIDRNNRIDAGREIVLPKPGWHITAGGPPGTNHIVAMVSRQRRDLAGSGLRQAGRDIPEFDLAQAQQRWSQRADASSPFVGRPVCEGGVACDDAYGAALLQVEEVAAPPRR